MFGHEKFEAYQLSLQYLKLALSLADEVPLGFASLRDQLRRSSVSISLNIAEGSGKTQIAERNRFYGIARGSAMECAAICDVLELVGVKYRNDIMEARKFLKSIVSILMSVCKN